LHFAQVQALRDEEINNLNKRIQDLQNLLSDAERMEKLHHLQEQHLKNEIRDLQRTLKRENANPEYLKNIMVKFIEFEDQREQLLPVIATVLQLSPAEMRRINERRSSHTNTFFSKVFK